MLVLIGLVVEGPGHWRDSLYSVPSPHLPIADHLVPLHPIVLAFVRVPTPRLRERLPAHPALVRLLARVRQFVLLQTRHLRESLCAPLELAGVRTLARVRAYVVLEVPGRGEGLAAFGVRADEGTFARVDPPVDVEVLRSVKSLPAARELTLAGPIRYVDLLDVRSEVSGEGERAFAARMVALVRLFPFNPLSPREEVVFGIWWCQGTRFHCLHLGLRVNPVNRGASP